MQVFTLEQICKERAEQLQAQGASVASAYNPSHFSHYIAQRDAPAYTKIQLQDVLRSLLTLLAQTTSLEALLPALTSLVQHITHADLCVILLPDRQEQILEVRSCVPDLSDRGVLLQNVYIERTLLQRLHHELLIGRMPSLAVHEYALVNPLENVQFEALLTLPLLVNDECIGVVNCYAQKSRTYTADEQLILTTIAQQGALTLKNARSIAFEKRDARSLIQGFTHDLLSGTANGGHVFLQRRARCLGYDLDAPHVVIAMKIEQSIQSQEVRGQRSVTEEQQQTVYQCIQTHIQDTYAGSLLATGGSELICLLQIGNEADVEQINKEFRRLIQSIQEEQHVSLVAGMSNSCTAIDKYPQAYSEAQEAQEIGPYLTEEGDCTSFCTLGAYRYIYDFARANKLPDQYQNQIALIQKYDDQHKSTYLLPTLEIYLECGTNIADASRLLGIHRNTLLQRLDRLKMVCNLDLKQHAHWLPLQIALKLHKLSGAKDRKDIHEAILRA